MYGCLPPDLDEWISTQHAPKPKEFSKATVAARGPAGKAALEQVRRLAEQTTGKPHEWQDAGDAWRLVEAPPPHEKVRKTK